MTEFESESSYRNETKAQKPRRQQKFIDPDQSVLLTDWEEPSRPFSRKEIEFLHGKLFEKLMISEMIVHHPECGHKYRVKKNGVKHKQLLEDPENRGNCSVCWKIQKTPRRLKDAAHEFVGLAESGRTDYFGYTVNSIFYTWLYNEMYEDRRY